MVNISLLHCVTCGWGCVVTGEEIEILWFCIVNAVQNFYNKNIKYLGVNFIWNN